ILVAHTLDYETFGLALHSKRAIGAACDGAGARRNRIAMRTGSRMTQQLVDPILELLADVVLQPFGFLVHVVPREAHRAYEIELQQPVMPDDLERHLLAGFGELDRLIRGVRDETELRQATHHLADRGRADA